MRKNFNRSVLWSALALALIGGAGIALTQSRRFAGPIVGGVTPQNWTLTPAGFLIQVGERPFGMALSPDGRRLAISNNGVGEQSVMLIDTRTNDVVRTVSVTRPGAVFYGLAFSPDGKTLYAAGGSSNEVRVYDMNEDALKLLGTIKLPTRKVNNAEQPIYAAGLTLSADGKTLYVANTLNNSVSVIDTAQRLVVTTIPVETNPYAVHLSQDGTRVYVSNWAASSVSVIDTETRTVRGSVKVGDHPCALALSPDGRQLYVANANSDTVSVIDTRTDGVVQTISLQPYPNAPAGSAPNALAVSPDGKTLYVANAGNNDVAVVDVSGTTPQVVGLIPVGWYPTGVEVSRDGKKIYALSAKGLGAGPNPLYGVAGSPVRQYIGSMVRGILSAIPHPDEATLSRYTKQVIANNGFDERRAERTIEAKPTAIPRRVGDPSPIKHVIYIIKENRTYDQVLGDMPQGNGDPSLVLFGREVTPNHHAIAEEFVLLDNFYVDGSVSEDGHPWSCAAVATDAVEKAFPSNYGGRRPQWDGVVRHPTAGYIWDFCARKGLTYRSYGEMARRTSEGRDVATTGLKGHFCPDFAPKDNNQPADMQRADVFLREFKEFEQNNNLPNFIIMSLPANHTRGTAPGAFTPKAMVADNDLALGCIVDAVSHSKYWKETAIFVVEDDAQNGPDHVDAHRTVALVISPYVKRRFVDSTMYDTVAMLRTMELILGLPPMTQFDAAAAPMMTCFTNKPNLKPYTVRDALISLIEKNKPTAYGAQESLAMNFDEIDEAPWDDLNRILWHSIKGEDVPMPKPKSKRRVLGMWGVQ